MLHLLNLEWKKQKDYNLFKVLIIAFIILLPAVLLIGKKMDVGNDAPFNPLVDFFQFPTVWKWLAYIGNWLTFFVFGFMAVLLMTNEHSNKTLRQNIITGLQRREFFWSKVVFIGALSLFATLYYALCALAFGLIHNTGNLYFSTVFKNWDYMLRFFLMCAGYMSFGLLVGTLIKRTGLALFIFLGYSIFLEPVIRWGIHAQLIKNQSMHYYPLNGMEDLCPVPFSDMADDFAKSNDFNLMLSPQEAVLITCFYMALFFWICYKRLEKSDL